MDLRTAASLAPDDALRRLGTSPAGLSAAEARARLRRTGPNAIERRRASPLALLGRQFASPFLILLIATAALSLLLHDRSDALLILGIVALSAGLSFANEFTSENAVADLRARVQRRAVVLRDGARRTAPAAELVPGDVVLLAVGDVVPADLRLLAAHDLECDESALTGEPLPAPKALRPAGPGEGPLGLACCAYFGTVVTNGAGSGVVVATGRAAALGAIAHQLAHRPPQTAFQQGLQGFSLLLVRITVILTAAIFVCNTLLQRPWLESLLFSLAIAIGLTPQLLPAIVTISLSVGARRLARRSVIVKRLVSIEDLGNVEVLFTDKTGTLTAGKVTFRAALAPDGTPSDEIAVLGLLCTDVVRQDGRTVSGNALDSALWEGASLAQRAAAARYRVLDRAPFDYERRMMSVLVEAPDGRRWLLAKGAPEALAARAPGAGPAFARLVGDQLAGGTRALALARRDGSGLSEIHPADEHDLAPCGLLAFGDELKPSAAESVRRLEALGVRLKIVTGDSDVTARFVCRALGLPADGVLSGAEIEALDDAALSAALERTTIFARVTPEQKSRIIRLQRAAGNDVGFLGDGVNDAVALHDADVGISVDSACDVAKDAADIVLLEQDLSILADGVVEGRRIFANTMKYVLMGTSSNFGNMFSAAAASLFLPFLPMLPSQILLNNLLYDVSEMTIPGDQVDPEQLGRPAHWDMRFIRRFMLAFGPISSLFDLLTFALMLLVFHAGAALFRSGWFVESLATQSLVIFLIRTRRMPFWRSRPSAQLGAATLGIVAVGLALPFTPLAAPLGFVPLPPAFFAALALMIAAYLGLIELGKALFFRAPSGAARVRAAASGEPEGDLNGAAGAAGGAR